MIDRRDLEREQKKHAQTSLLLQEEKAANALLVAEMREKYKNFLALSDTNSRLENEVARLKKEAEKARQLRPAPVRQHDPSPTLHLKQEIAALRKTIQAQNKELVQAARKPRPRAKVKVREVYTPDLTLVGRAELEAALKALGQ